MATLVDKIKSIEDEMSRFDLTQHNFNTITLNRSIVTNHILYISSTDCFLKPKTILYYPRAISLYWKLQFLQSIPSAGHRRTKQHLRIWECSKQSIVMFIFVH